MLLKRTFTLWLLGVLYLGLYAQETPPCTPSPTKLFKAVITTPVKCGEDGQITIQPQVGADAVLVDHYELKSKDGKVRFNNPASVPLFTRLIPGHYTITIKGILDKGKPSETNFCGTVETELTFTPFAPHITEYVPPSKKIGQDYDRSSRISFVKEGVDYSLGRFVFKVRDGLNPKKMEFSIDAFTPEQGVTPLINPPLNTILPIKDFEVVEEGVPYQYYTIDTNLPAGHYIFRVTDGCLSTPQKVTLPAAKPEDFWFQMTLNTQSPMNADLRASWETNHEEVHRLLHDRLFEFGFGFKQTPPSSWSIPPPFPDKGIHYFGYIKNLTAEQLPDYYDTHTLNLRVAGREASTFGRSFSFSSPPPPSAPFRWEFGDSYIAERRCNDYYAWFPWVYNVPASSFTYVVTKNGDEIYRNTNWTNQNENIKQYLEYDQEYVAAIYINGKLFSEKTFSYPKPPIELLESPSSDVAYLYDIDVAFSLKYNLNCPALLRIELEDGTLVHEVPMNGTTKVRLNYDTKYRAKLLDAATRHPIASELWPVIRKSNLPEKVTFEPYSITACDQHPWVDWPGGYYGNPRYNKSLPQGARITITFPSDPNFKPVVLTQPSNTYVYLPRQHYAPGIYKMHVELDPTNPNAPTRDYDVDFPGGMQLVAPTVVDIANDCNEYSITPYATIKEIRDSHGVVLSSSGVNTILEYWNEPTQSWITRDNQLRSGKTHRTRTPGKYRLLVGDKNCPLEIKEFELVPNRPRIKYFKTIAYRCGTNAHVNRILIEAEAGKAPYKYDFFLYDKSKPNAKGAATGLSAIGKQGEQVEFANIPSNHYTIEITDNCGERFWYDIEVSPLFGRPLIHAADKVICTGKSLHFNTFAIKDATIRWYKKDNPTKILAEGPEFTIPSVTLDDAGTYLLEVTPMYCDAEVFRDEMEITILPSLTQATLQSDRSTLCLGHTANFSINISDGSKPYTYSWEMSEDNGIKWQPYTGTSSTNSYTWTSGQWGDTKQWRCTITDGCGTSFTTDPVSVVLKQCYVPVNPHLMLKTTTKSTK